MPRGHIKLKRHDILPDTQYGSTLVSKFMNHIMVNGKKSVAERIVYDAFDQASKQLNLPQLDVFQQVLKNVGPILEIKSKRIGGANYQVPVEVGRDRRNTLAIRWIITAARAKKGEPMASRLAKEFIDAFHGEGAAIKKREDTHRMAEANKAFAHFARF